jgi:kinetochore protein Spc25
LGLSIEGLGKDDRLKFVYKVERKWEREAWLELDTSEREYKGLEVRPNVERKEVRGVY